MPLSIDHIAAQLKRHTPAEINDGGQSAWASVAVIFRDEGAGAELLLIERAAHEKDPWSGHMAFPGGRRDPQDPAIVATAVRETQEEVHLDLSAHGKLLGQLDDLQAVGSGRRLPLIIRPFVFHLPEARPLYPNHEVASTVWVPLAWIADPSNEGTFDYHHGDDLVQLPCLKYDRYTIWGLTLQMLQTLLEAVATPQPSSDS